MGTIDIIDDPNGFSSLDENIQEKLKLLGIPLVFDFSRGELIFEISQDDVIVFDFEQFTIQEIDNLSFESSYLCSINQVPQYYLDQIQILESEIQTDIVIFGEGFYQYLAVKIYNNYLVIGQILIDIDDDTPPDDDPDGGEPIPDVEVGDFFVFYEKYVTIKLSLYINYLYVSIRI